MQNTLRPSNRPENSGRKSITRMLWLVIAGMLCLFLAAFAGSTAVITERARRDYEIRNSETAITGMVSGIRASIDSYKDISRLIITNDDVIKYLCAEESNIWLARDATDGVMSVLNVFQSIDSVYLIRSDYSYVNNGRGLYDVDFEKMKQDDWLEDIISRRGGIAVSVNGNGALFRHDKTPIVTLARAIYDTSTRKQVGILLMNVSQNLFNRIAAGEGAGEVSLAASDGTFLAGDPELLEWFEPGSDSDVIRNRTIRINRERKTVSSYAMEDLPFVVMCSVQADTADVPPEIFAILLSLLLVFLVCMLITGVFITHNLTVPIRNLAASMERTKSSGWLEPLDVIVPPNEIGMLAESYNSMIEHLNNLFNQVIEEEKSVQKAEMRVLYEQIKPHFLYNSLESISYMALEAGAADVQEALETLSRFYRNFVSKGERNIPLRREIRITKDYLALQKLRYGEILSDEYDIDEAALDCMVPKLILQPLVENSIYHGIKLKGEDCVIRVSSRLKSDGLHITVYDTGVGMSEEEISAALNPRETDDVPDQGDVAAKGFGLRGTVARIRYYCENNDEEAVKIRSEVGEYTEIELIVPQMRKETECTE